MAVNRYRKHMVIFLEDKPYRELVNGAQIIGGLNNSVIDVKKPCGGWKKVFESFEKNISLLEKYPKCNILLLMDFDDKNIDSEESFKYRMSKFNEVVPEQDKNRVFLLGVNYKESESLLKVFKKSNFEDIGKILIENCPDSNENWEIEQLKCNLVEIQRMRKLKIFEWLFDG